MDESIPQLPRSIAAMERLERALQRLEVLAERPSGDLFAPPPPDEPAPSPDQAKREHLEAVAAQAERRLDGVIERLRQILGE